MDYEKLEKIFLTDIKIKEIMYSMAPSSSDYSSIDDKFDYCEKFYNRIIDLEDSMVEISEILQSGTDIIKEFFQKLKKEFMSCNYDIDKVSALYKTGICDMREDFVQRVQNSFAGYKLFMNLGKTLMEAKTVNELLHAFHSYVVNNDAIYRRIPVVQSNGKEISLRGQETPLAKLTYDACQNIYNTNIIDILSLKDLNKILVMIRGRGHATSIEIENEGDLIYIKYFIPKIINPDMINLLPGVNKVPADADPMDTTRGEFAVSPENFQERLNNFISMIPMDEDFKIDYYKTL